MPLDLDLYLDLDRLLLEHGRPQPVDGARRGGGAASGGGSVEHLCAWLDDEDLEQAAPLLLSQGARLAQEQVGVELLARLQPEDEGQT